MRSALAADNAAQQPSLVFVGLDYTGKARSVSANKCRSAESSWVGVYERQAGAHVRR